VEDSSSICMSSPSISSSTYGESSGPAGRRLGMTVTAAAPSQGRQWRNRERRVAVSLPSVDIVGSRSGEPIFLPNLPRPATHADAAGAGRSPWGWRGALRRQDKATWRIRCRSRGSVLMLAVASPPHQLRRPQPLLSRAWRGNLSRTHASRGIRLRRRLEKTRSVNGVCTSSTSSIWPGRTGRPRHLARRRGTPSPHQVGGFS
jgi:hypothetical protein